MDVRNNRTYPTLGDFILSLRYLLPEAILNSPSLLPASQLSPRSSPPPSALSLDGRPSGEVSHNQIKTPNQISQHLEKLSNLIWCFFDVMIRYNHRIPRQVGIQKPFILPKQAGKLQLESQGTVYFYFPIMYQKT